MSRIVSVSRGKEAYKGSFRIVIIIIRERKKGKVGKGFYEIIQANNPVWEADHDSP